MFVCGKALDLETVPTPEQVTLARLEDQIRWYDRRSAHSQTRFKWMKGTTIASAAIIPLLTAAGVPHSAEMAAALGVLIGIIEGVNNGAAYGLGQQWSQTVIFIILITLMVFKPEGILGRRTTEKV